MTGDSYSHLFECFMESLVLWDTTLVNSQKLRLDFAWSESQSREGV